MTSGRQKEDKHMVLLDTCALLWLVSDQTKLSEKARHTIVRNVDRLFVSAITAFELAVKQKHGKLKLPLPPQEWFAEALIFHGIRELPVSSGIAMQSVQLPPLHNDPCDRIIIATAQMNDMGIITSDRLIRQYPDTKVIW
jgi:PIN domain nuclease of toxin-antitoxin system